MSTNAKRQLAIAPGYTLFTLGDHFQFRPQYLDINGNPAFEDWLAVGQSVEIIEENGPWWYGDHLLYGQRTYPGDLWAQIVSSDTYRKKDGKTKMSVCRKFPLERRRPELSFTHHREVMGLPTAEQEELLDLAIKEDLSTDELRREVAKRRDQRQGGNKRRAIVRAKDAALYSLEGNLVTLAIDPETAEALASLEPGAEVYWSLSTSEPLEESASDKVIAQ